MNKIIVGVLAILFAGLGVMGCKKSTSNNPDDQNAVLQNVDYNQRLQLESDAAADDANAVLAGVPILNGDGGAATNPDSLNKLVAGADSVVYDSADQKLVIYYDNTTVVNNRIRSGSLSVQLISGNSWSDSLSVILLTFTQYTSVKNNSTIIINGKNVVTNLNGGVVSKLIASNQDSVSHQISTVIQGGLGLYVNYDTTKAYKCDTWRTRDIKYVNTTIVNNAAVRQYKYTIHGDYKVESHYVSWWGNTIYGQTFFNDIGAALIVYDQSVDRAGPVSGQMSINGITIASIRQDLSITYGVNQSGNVVSSPTVPYGYLVSWVDLNGKNRTAVASY